MLSDAEGGEGGPSNAGGGDYSENSQFAYSDFDVDESLEGVSQLFETVVEEVGLGEVLDYKVQTQYKARRSTRLQGTNPISNDVIAQQATTTVRSNFNPPRRMPTTNLPNLAPIPPARGGVTIRPPVPFARGHPRVPLGISKQKMTPIQHPFKVIDKDGQKYVTMKGLEDALNARRKVANKVRKELDGKGKKL
ncbi:hypothetical protein Salat_1431700 [Sesamum alatum]|uniref:Uncharacterized protein n=1 Tax=Sesamum alatum TaxID=300844 RepID=A0AAE1YAP4_9LAMI|nr:hypothetical protein Salat_1431700 [Sesamum alatum]